MKLKSCPFCGGEAYLWQNYNNSQKVWFVYARCEDCNSTGRTVRSDEEPDKTDWNNNSCQKAVRFWNKRLGEM